MGNHLKKGYHGLSFPDSTNKLIQKPFDPSRLLAPPNARYFKEILKENRRQSSLLCCIKKALAGIHKVLSCGKKAVTPGRASPQNISIPATYAFLINEKGRRPLTKIRYAKILACANRYNMFIDGCSMRASKKAKGADEPLKSTLNPTGFALLKEFIESPQPMSLLSIHTKIPDRLKKDEQTALKYFQEARAMADFKEGRYRWKCFKSISGKAENTVFQFNPPPKYKYCLIVPANWA